MNATLAARWDVKGHDLKCQPAGWDNGNKKDLERAIKYIREEKFKSSPRLPKLPGERGQTAACVGNTKVKWLNDVSIPALSDTPFEREREIDGRILM